MMAASCNFRNFDQWARRWPLDVPPMLVMNNKAALSIILMLFHMTAFAVGTWGGGEPPFRDDVAPFAGWWSVPVVILALVAQFVVFAKWPAQSFGALFIFLIAATVEKWFGMLPAVIVALIGAIHLFRATRSTKPIPVSDSKSEVDPVQSVTVIPPFPQVDGGEPASNRERREVERIAALRRRIDSEARNSKK